MARDLSKETDVQVLQHAIRLLEHENARLVLEVEKLVKEIVELRGQDPINVQLRLQALEQQLEHLRKKLFGQSSERTASPKEEEASEGAKEASTTEKEEAANEKPTASTDDSEPAPQKPERRRSGRRPQALPVRPLKHGMPEAECKCSVCGKRMVRWQGQFESSHEIHLLRRAFVDVEHHLEKFRCVDGCTIVTAPPPRKLFRGARYSIGIALETAIQKYLYHMPLARQVRQMRSEGLAIDTQTLWDQLDRLAALLLPVYKRICEYVLSQLVIGVDETTWRVMGKQGPESKKTWLVWTVATLNAVYYQIENSRSTDTAQKILGGYQGTIICDGYNAYPALARRESGITLAFCWAHARRKYNDLKRFFPVETKTIIGLIDMLFAIDRAAPTGDSDEALAIRHQLRNQKSRAVIAQINRWATEVRTLPGTGLAEAIRYMTDHWSGLVRFLEDPHIPLSNNITERANRDPVLGRKNHYGSRSVRGTQVAAILYSLLESAKNAGADAHAYLELAVESALDGRAPQLPHEVLDEVKTRAEQHVAQAASRFPIELLNIAEEQVKAA